MMHSSTKLIFLQLQLISVRDGILYEQERAAAYTGDAPTWVQLLEITDDFLFGYEIDTSYHLPEWSALSAEYWKTASVPHTDMYVRIVRPKQKKE